jgi:hypothetical protein
MTPDQIRLEEMRIAVTQAETRKLEAETRLIEAQVANLSARQRWSPLRLLAWALGLGVVGIAATLGFAAIVLH